MTWQLVTSSTTYKNLCFSTILLWFEEFGFVLVSSVVTALCFLTGLSCKNVFLFAEFGNLCDKGEEMSYLHIPVAGRTVSATTPTAPNCAVLFNYLFLGYIPYPSSCIIRLFHQWNSRKPTGKETAV